VKHRGVSRPIPGAHFPTDRAQALDQKVHASEKHKFVEGETVLWLLA
jgi:hypothetical protein